MTDFLMALSMFTKIPVKYVNFEGRTGAGAIAAFPAVGLLCGGFTTLTAFFAAVLGLRSLTAAALLLLSVFAVCGFLHFDGFMDAADALLSSRDRETKVKILKDSSVGAFGVLAAALLLIADFASFECLYYNSAPVYIYAAAAVLSRATGGIILLCGRPLSNEGLGAFFSTGKKFRHYLVLVLFAAVAAAVFICGGTAYIIAASISAVSALLLSMAAVKKLGGINGDIIGAGIVLSEAVFYMSAAILLSVGVI